MIYFWPTDVLTEGFMAIDKFRSNMSAVYL